MQDKTSGGDRLWSRRSWLGAGAAAAMASAVARPAASAVAADEDAEPFRVRNRRIHQSVMGWCFKPMPVPELIQHSRDIGLEAIEGIGAEHYPLARERGLKISLVSSHGFARGPVDPANRTFCVDQLRAAIDRAVEFESPSVITFTGMRVDGMRDAVAERNCVECWKEIIDYAEEKNVNLCLEHLNSRDTTHPMKGHPGYFGDDVELCIDLIKRVDSPRMKLLFDIYHVQIMNGDIIRRIRQYHPYIGHYHTAGNPGRGELDDTQEINYPPIMKAILETGYTGYVAQEFIPTWPDPVAALRHAAQVCDV